MENEIIEGEDQGRDQGRDQGGENQSTPVTKPEGGAEPEPKQEGGGFQKRIDEITQKRREAEHDAAYWRGRAESKTVPVAQETPSEPEEAQDLDPNDFDSDADYLKAVATQTRNEIRATAAAEKKREMDRVGQVTIAKQYQDARAKYADFDKVALSPSVQITQQMFDAARGDSLGDVLYHLGENPTEAARIAVLSPTQQIKEIGKIETKLTTTPTPETSTTPNPPTTIGGGRGSIPTKKEEEMNRAELHQKWEAERLKEAGL